MLGSLITEIEVTLKIEQKGIWTYWYPWT